MWSKGSNSERSISYCSVGSTSYSGPCLFLSCLSMKAQFLTLIPLLQHTGFHPIILIINNCFKLHKESKNCHQLYGQIYIYAALALLKYIVNEMNKNTKMDQQYEMWPPHKIHIYTSILAPCCSSIFDTAPLVYFRASAKGCIKETASINKPLITKMNPQQVQWTPK